jgi:L-ectoine synthase
VIVRDLENSKTVEWGNGTSVRFLVAADGVGYTVCDTIVRAGTRSKLEYRNHLESCYCIGGTGSVVEDDGTAHPLTPGTLYSLNNNDPHWLVADADEDLHLVSVFVPALRGDEVHNLTEGATSAY